MSAFTRNKCTNICIVPKQHCLAKVKNKNFVVSVFTDDKCIKCKEEENEK